MQGYDANRDHEYTQQMPFDFGRDSRERCVEGIRGYLAQQICALDWPVTLRELIKDCVSGSPGSTQHFLDGTQVLHAAKDIVVCDADGKVRRSAKHTGLAMWLSLRG